MYQRENILHTHISGPTKKEEIQIHMSEYKIQNIKLQNLVFA